MKNITTYSKVAPEGAIKNWRAIAISILLFSSCLLLGQTSQIFTNSGTFTVPQGVPSITIDCIGAGGSGGSGRGTNNQGAGGGAGGQYAQSTIAVSAGQVFTVKVAGVTAGPPNRNTTGNNGDFSAVSRAGITHARANGGKPGIAANASRDGGLGDVTEAIGNIVIRKGGNGGNGTNSSSGGGGGGAGTNGNGGDATGTTAGTGATLFGGNGGAGQINTNPGLAGKNYGGGGSGGRRSNVGGAGAQGYVQISFTCPTINSNAGTNQTLASCAVTATLSATAPTYGTGVWSVVSGSGTVTAPSSRNSGVTGIVPGVPLVLSWTVTNGSCGSTASNVTITSPIGPACINPYCIPNPSSVDGTGITRVAIGSTINNTDTRISKKYNDYSSLRETVAQSATVPFKLQLNTGYWYYYSIWVDWNNDGDFTDLNEEVAYGNINNTLLTSNFIVPTFASAGNHRLRVGIRWGDFPTYCYTGVYAQFEDYTLDVTNLCTTGIPSSTFSNTYISGLASTGTLNDMVSAGSAGYSINGYKDNTSITLATQIPNGPVNLDMDLTGPTGSFIYVFVDWNNNGNFNDAGETVYSTTNFTTGQSIATDDTSFGFIVPPGMVAGNYTMRVRTSPYDNIIPGDGGISPCATGYSSGEAEDFTLKVVADCPSKITSVISGSSCGPGVITIGATSPGATQFKWYDSKKGGTLLQTTSIGSWTSPLVVATTTYYVTSVNASCESLYRTPVVATVFPVADITFTPTTPEICGTASIIKLSATGDSSVNDLFVENFETGLGKFSAVQVKGSISSAPWSVKTSSYIPNNTTVFKPAINSGGAGTSDNKFAFTTSDLAANDKDTSRQALQTTKAIDTNGYTSLTLTFDQYYSHYMNDNVYVQVSLNGAAYITVATFSADDGSAGDFAPTTINFTPYINITNLKFRIRYDALWDDGYAVDNFRLYGTKPLASNFDWGENDGTMYTDAAATMLYVDNALVSNIYIKPDVAAGTSFNYAAQTTLPNGCLVTKIIPVINNTKVSTGVSTAWNSINWLPGNTAPTADKCVIVKNEVTLASGEIGLAKNLVIQTGGNLIVGGNLTVTDFINNETGDASKFTVNSEGNLKQVTETFLNAGNITVKRESPMKKNNYTYWSSPVFGQNLYGFSPGTSTTRFYYYRESDDKFYNDTFNGSSVFTPGQGFAIMAPSSYAPELQTFKGSFVGVPNNGTNASLQFQLKLSVGGDKGYNMIGNPYPSNIDFDKLFTNNGGVNGRIYQTAYFWTNVDPNRAGSTNGTGSTYSGNAYAIYNGVGGVPPADVAGAQGGTPTKIIKVGQGFIVKARPGQDNAKLIFNNTIRDVVGASVFFSKGSASDKDRYWLKLTSPALDVNTILIGYVPGATNEFEWDYDAPLLSVGSDSFYSILNDEILGIQGRIYPLSPQDVVQLGTKHFEMGNYTISLGDREGIFAETQNIYLKDKQTGTLTNLSKSDYTFTATVGVTDGRFEIIYQPEIVLGSGANIKDQLVVYRDGNDYVVKSQFSKITALELYDYVGRLILKLKSNQTELRINGGKLVNGVYLLKLTRNGELRSIKIMK